MHKTILWDNDGVLVDSEDLYFEASRSALAEVGVTLDRVLYIDISLRKGESTLDLALKKGLGPAEVDDIKVRRNELYSRLLKEKVKPRDGIRECLEFLKGKVRMGIVSSSLREHFNVIHLKTGFLSYFDFVLTREDYRRSKPDPEPYLTAMKRFGLQKENCIAVEDTERGVAAAKAAGLLCLAAPSGITKAGDFQQAEKVFNSIPELTTELKSWMGL